AAVDLELVEGDVPQLHQGRVAGAEVVDGQADVLEPEAGEDIQGGDAVAHQPALGDFQHQPRQGHRVAGGGGGDEVGKLQRRQVVHRQVDGDVELEVPGTPLPHLGKGHRQHLAGEVVDQAVVLGEANELIGPHQTVLGVLPAHQGLDPHDVAAGEVHHRLVVIDQLATGDAPGQFVGGVAPCARARAEHLAGLGLEGEDGGQVGGADGFAQRPQHPQLVGLGKLFGGLQHPDIFAADQYHPTLIADVPEVAHQLDAVDVRHVQVAEHQVRVLAAVPQQGHR